MVKWRATLSLIVSAGILVAITATGIRGDERKPDVVRLPKALDNFLQQELAPAYAAGNPTSILEVLRSRLPRLRDAQIEQIDKVLRSRMLPTVAGTIGHAHLAAMRAKLDVTKDMGVKEACLALQHTLGEIKRLLANVRMIQLMDDPLPQPDQLEDFRDLLWSAHVQKNQLLGVKDLVQLGETLNRNLSPRARRNATQQQVTILESRFSPYLSQTVRLQRDLEERALELRVDRIEFAVITLLDEEDDLKLRFAAASAIAVDSEAVIKRLKADQGKFRRDTLNEQTVLKQVESNSKEGEELAGDLIKKSKLLYAGLHWWLRGRYGSGPEGNGLLKVQAAERDPAARISLFMPQARPVPTDPMKSQRSVPDHDRRHHYTWAWHDRQFAMTTFQRKESYLRATGPGEHLDFRLNGKFY